MKKANIILAAVPVQQIGLIPVMLLMVFYFNATVLATNLNGTGINASPVQYVLSVDSKSIILWAYNINGEAFFKLRDIAMALSGTDKQFDISFHNDADYKEVDMAPENAYTPVGHELSKPDNMENAAAQSTPYSFYCKGRVSILAYIVNSNHYIKLSDLSATLKFASNTDETKQTAAIDTSHKIVSEELTGETIDNLSNTGNYYSLGDNGIVTLSYNNGETSANAPLKLNISDQYVPGMMEYETGFYISEHKTAIAYGGDDSPIKVLISDDMGKTWNTCEVESSKYLRAIKYISFDTVNDGWLTASAGVALGTSYNFIFATHDGGKTWTQIGNPNDIYPRAITGAGFANNQIGFLCFRYEFKDFEPAICRTIDGGYTWEKLYLTLPDEYKDFNKTPLSPIFSGAKGLFPIKLSKADGDYATLYLSSADYGKTWTYDEKYSLAHMWAEAVKNRDGRKQYKLLSRALQSESYDGYVSFDWKTGASSPWVDTYSIKLIPDGAVITYYWASSTGPEGNSSVTLSFASEDGTLQIGAISGNSESSAIDLKFISDKLYYKKLPVI